MLAKQDDVMLALTQPANEFRPPSRDVGNVRPRDEARERYPILVRVRVRVRVRVLVLVLVLGLVRVLVLVLVRVHSKPVKLRCKPSVPARPLGKTKMYLKVVSVLSAKLDPSSCAKSS